MYAEINFAKGFSSMQTKYRTVAKNATAQMIEKKSRFIANVLPVQTEEEALKFINETRSEHRTATHNVYAYIISENNICRYSDDGEPSGTAGLPTLDVLRKENLTNVAIVITRYFGGILLGGGGLVRAYGASAKLGIDTAKIVTKTLCDIVKVETDYTTFGKISYETCDKGYTVKDTIYDANVSMYVYCEVDDTQNYISYITDISNARAICTKIGCEYLLK